MKIIRNAIKCKQCGEVIESRSRHDYKMCECGCCGVDGGLDYLRRIYCHSQEEYIELSECIE